MREPDLGTRPHALDIAHCSPLPPRVLYRAWTERLDRWFAAPGSVAMRAEAGAPFFFEVEHRPAPDAAAQRHPHYGRFLELVPDRRVRLTWVTGTGGTAGAETVVTVEFEPDGDGSRVRLRHAGFADAGARDRHLAAWPMVLTHQDEALGRYLASDASGGPSGQP